MSGTKFKTPKALAKKMSEVIGDILYLQMLNSASSILSDAATRKKYKNLTGNTLTSLSAGLFVGKKLKTIVNVRSVMSLPDPTRPKISSEGGSYEFSIYQSGRRKRLWGNLLKNNFIEADDTEFGFERAMNVLKAYSPNNEFELVITTGTEYSAYLQYVKNLNVLLETFKQVENGGLFLQKMVSI